MPLLVKNGKGDFKEKGRGRRMIEGGNVCENKRDDREKMEEKKGRMRKDSEGRIENEMMAKQDEETKGEENEGRIRKDGRRN